MRRGDSLAPGGRACARKSNLLGFHGTIPWPVLAIAGVGRLVACHRGAATRGPGDRSEIRIGARERIMSRNLYNDLAASFFSISSAPINERWVRSQGISKLNSKRFPCIPRCDDLQLFAATARLGVAVLEAADRRSAWRAAGDRFLDNASYTRRAIRTEESPHLGSRSCVRRARPRVRHMWPDSLSTKLGTVSTL